MTTPVIDAVMRLRLISTPSETDLQETRSDSDGAFAFKPVASGRNYLLRYALVPAGGSGGTTVTLGPTGTHLIQPWSPLSSELTDFDFAVTDLDDEPVRGARIVWHRLLGSVESDCVNGAATSDAGGRAIAPAIAPGRYRVTIEADGFVPQTIDIVHEWGRHSLSVRLLTPRFLANITTGVVAPMRKTRQISPIIAQRKGMPAAQFIQAVRSALK